MSPGKIYPAHEQKEYQANLALGTSEQPEEGKLLKWSASINSKYSILSNLATALPPPWPAFGVVIPAYHKVVHKARGLVVLGHDRLYIFNTELIWVLAWLASAPFFPLIFIPLSPLQQTFSSSSSSKVKSSLNFPIISITNHRDIFVFRHFPHQRLQMYHSLPFWPENMSE